MKHADTKPTKKWLDGFKHRTGLGVNKIENKHVHECTKKCITSKTMLYTLALKVYDIENDIIHFGLQSV